MNYVFNDYNSMVKNIVFIVNYLCAKSNYLVDIYRYKNDIRIDIVDKAKDKIIYQHDYENLVELYNLLIDDLLNIFSNNEVVISRLLKEKSNLYQQRIYMNNLEFRFDVNNKNEDEIENAANRHNTINRNAQEHRTLKLKKTNPSKLVVAG